MSLNDSLSVYERAQLAVWDYPVSDKYTRIYQEMINGGMPLSMEEALEKMEEGEQDGGKKFALIGEMIIKLSLAS